MTPEEAWSSFKPSVAHLRVFGCIASAKIPEARRIKLDDKGEKCIFVGYGDRVMGYKLYNPLTKKVIISRDVVFEEAQTWSWEDKKVASSSEIVHDQQEDAREVEEPDSPTSSQGPVGRPRRMRNLNDIYEATEEVDEAVEENMIDGLPEGAPPLEMGELPPYLYCLAEQDLMWDTQMEFYEEMKRAGKEVELLVSRGVGHCFYLNKIAVDMDPFTAALAQELIQRIKQFIHHHSV
ncbi:hypothetical protein SASPL_104104 [Salvia splendens]|uniref:Gibberellin receptor GID1 n=1 Tax=Salvia splendens TaxID=180675 RepID=A0A8X8YGK0_SALSN|nr:hypothetical protein SASPL_104104 [Salvia splendens]